MNAQEVQAFKKQIQSHVRVFVVLLAGTLLSVGISFLQVPVPAKVGIALTIAAAQAVLIAGVLMHLSTEKRSIVLILAITGVFFMGLGVLTVWASHDAPDQTQHLQVPTAHTAPAHHVP
jgi:FtsH-binding integral membrane protein